MWFLDVFVFELFLGARVEHRNEHVGDLFSDERQTPFENIFEVW